MKKLYETITAENWNHDGPWSDDLSRACLIVHYNARYRPHDRAAWTRLMQASGMLYPERLTPRALPLASYFNDHPDTTLEDVLRVCKLADV